MTHHIPKWYKPRKTIIYIYREQISVNGKIKNKKSKRRTNLSESEGPLDSLHDFWAYFSLENVIEKALQKPTVIFKALKGHLLCYIICYIRHFFFDEKSKVSESETRKPLTMCCGRMMRRRKKKKKKMNQRVRV